MSATRLPECPVTNSRARELQEWFTYHAPQGDQGARYTEIRARCGDLAYLLCLLCPDGMELREALTHLRNVMMWGNAAIACHLELLPKAKEKPDGDRKDPAGGSAPAPEPGGSAGGDRPPGT